jgi:hypothetical protein
MEWLLRNTTRFIKSLNDRFVGNVKLQLAIAKELIIRLESARDRRALAAHKERLKQDMKLRSLTLSSCKNREGPEMATRGG